jgi:hypothetical protein
MSLDVGDPVAGIEFVLAAVEVLGDEAEQDDWDVREVEGRLLAHQRRWRAFSSLPTMVRASEPPIKLFRDGRSNVCFMIISKVFKNDRYGYNEMILDMSIDLGHNCRNSRKDK